MASLILNFGRKWRWVVMFAFRALSSRYPLNVRLGGFHTWYGRFGEERIFLPVSGFEPRTVQSVASSQLPTEVSKKEE